MSDAAASAEAFPAPPASTAPGASPPPISTAMRRYAMWLLLGIYIINFLDRQVVNILAEHIKHDLHLADWQLGLMSGLAFAVFYTFLGIPIARLAERANRPLIIGGAVAAWSGFTMLCGVAQNFTQLVLFRIGVGVGEAGCTPPAHSLIADYTPREKRASAMAFYSMGTPIGTLLGLMFGGLIADAYGWRMAFMVAGAPGLIFALLAIFTLPEPRRKIAGYAAYVHGASATFGETLKVLMGKRTFWLIAFAAAIKAFIGYGHAPFTTSFFLRNHSVEIAGLAAGLSNIVGFQIKSLGFMGLALGILGGAAGTFGALLGGWIADRYGRNDLRAYMVAPAIASLVTVPIYIVAVTVPSAALAIPLLMVNALLGTLWYGPVYATGQGLVPPHMRATTSAVLLFIINLIGLGLGPLFVGLLSDVFADANLAAAGLSVAQCKGSAGTAIATACREGSGFGIRWALIGSTLVGVVAFALFWTARKTIREETVS